MSRVSHTYRNARKQLPTAVVLERFQQVQRARDIINGVEGLSRPLVRVALAVVSLGIALGELRRIVEQDGQQIATRAIGVDRPAVAALHEQGQTPAMIDMRVAQHHSVDRARVEREWLAIALGRLSTALDHPAIEQQLFSCRSDNVTRSGHFTRGAEEFDFHDAGE